MNLQLVTFNVNGLRSIKDYYAQSKLSNCPNFSDFLNYFEADILCFQEHKTNVPSKLSHDLSYPKGYVAFYAFPRIPKKIGYSGVVTFVKEQSPWLPIAWYDGFSGVNDKVKVPLHESPLLKSQFSQSDLLELDSEGRCVITDHFHFLLLNIYFPNDSGPARTDFREKFYKAVHLRCLDLVREHGKSLIILGDINITYHPLDHCEYAPLFKTITENDIKTFLSQEESSSNEALKEFYTNPMRKWLAEWLYNHDKSYDGWRDCFRSLHPCETNREKYTCWNTQISARGSNYGTRIDAIFTSGPLFIADESVKLEMCDIMPKVMGSDHCPVIARFQFPEEFREVHGSVLKDCKLTKGNIPRSFGNLDSFFKKRTEIEEQIEKEEFSVDVYEFIEEPKKKSKISDFFQSTKKTTTATTTILLETETAELIKSTEIKEKTEPTESLESSSYNNPLSNLFKKPSNIPKCKHGEDCKLNKVKKSGPNQGRSFYCCARPGGAGNDPEARCDFFEWSSRTRKL